MLKNTFQVSLFNVKWKKPAEIYCFLKESLHPFFINLFFQKKKDVGRLDYLRFLSSNAPTTRRIIKTPAAIAP
jgi:hypothetical protein